jgi:broad specificity phosphatase PhoE
VTTILLSRHGESDWNRDERWQGHADRPLTELGLEQAEALADRLEGIALDAVYASDLIRARQTAQVVAKRRGLPVIERADLREVDCGSWSGCRHGDIVPAQIERWRSGEKGWDGGESYEQMAARMVAAVRDIARHHDGAHVLVVSHGAAIRAVHAHALSLPFHEYRRLYPTVANAGLSAVAVENGAFSEVGPV